MDLMVFVVCMADLISCGVVFVWGKVKVQEQGSRLVGGGSSILPRRHAANLGFKEHGDDPQSTSHNDNGLSCGSPLLWLTKPSWAVVLLRLRRRQVVRMAFAEICFNGVLYQMFLDMRPLSLSLSLGF